MSNVKVKIESATPLLGSGSKVTKTAELSATGVFASKGKVICLEQDGKVIRLRPSEDDDRVSNLAKSIADFEGVEVEKG